jgi:hypothetical protein
MRDLTIPSERHPLKGRRADSGQPPATGGHRRARSIFRTTRRVSACEEAGAEQAVRRTRLR